MGWDKVYLQLIGYQSFVHQRVQLQSEELQFGLSLGADLEALPALVLYPKIPENHPQSNGSELY